MLVANDFGALRSIRNPFTASVHNDVPGRRLGPCLSLLHRQETPERDHGLSVQ